MESIARKFGFYIAVQENQKSDFFSARNRTNGLYIGSRIETDPVFEANLLRHIIPTDVVNSIKTSNHLQNLENRFSSWLLSHSTNTLVGLDNFTPDYSEGSTQGFDSFYLRHSKKRFRCFIGEYFYHIKTWESNGLNWSWTNGHDLKPGDALVISQPFCDTVEQFDSLNGILDSCNQLGIPVLLDLCYYIISDNLNINLEFDCIDTVTFSLSKAWPVSTARIGMRYTRKDIFDGQKLHSSIGYNNNLGAYIGNIILDNYTPDWISNSRRDKYYKICDVLALKQTASVCFGLGDDSWSGYSRRELLKSYRLDFDPNLFVNRICLNKIYQHWELFEEFLQNEYQIKI